MNGEEKEILTLHEVGDAVLMSNDPDSGTAHIQVFVEGRKYRTALTKKFLERKPWKAPNPNEVRSHIPGEIASILVKEGDRVEKGETLMIYEAMKMKNIISAPFDARIVAVAVKEGDKLPKGALLMELGE